MMTNLKMVIQSLIPDTHSVVKSAIIGFNSKYTYILESDKLKVNDLDQILCNRSDKHIIEDRLAEAAIRDFPHNSVGYIDSNRFIGNAPLYLLEKNCRILYGRVLVWNAWFLSLFFKTEEKSFTRVKGQLPFDVLNLDNINLEDSSKTHSSAQSILNMINILLPTKNSNQSAENEFLNLANQELYNSFNELKLDIEMIGDLNLSLIRKIINDENQYLETTIAPVENLYTAFYLCQKINDCSTMAGFSQSIYAMYGFLSMLNDFGLKNDYIKAAQIPIEYIRRIVLELDCINIRKNFEKNIKGSYLRKKDLYNIYMQIKNENWLDLIQNIATDKHEMNNSRQKDVFELFLINKKHTQYYYIVFLCSMFEKCRIIMSKTTHVKSTQRKQEFKLFTTLMVNFYNFVVQVTQKTGESEKLTIEEINDFFRIYENDIYQLIDVITRDGLIESCIDFLNKK